MCNQRSIETESLTYCNYVGGSGFIAAHVLENLLKRGHSVVTSVRSQEKAEFIKESHPSYGTDKLDTVIVEDIAQPDGTSPSPEASLSFVPELTLTPAVTN